MPGLLEELVLVNSTTSAEYDFLNPNCRVQEFSPTSQRRGSERPRMQAHGANPRSLLYGSLSIHQSGRLLALTPEELIAERQSLLYALLGDLSVVDAPPVTETGTLTVRFAGWTESASALVSVEHWECPLKAADGVKTAEYMIDFEAVAGYFLGDDSLLPYQL